MGREIMARYTLFVPVVLIATGRRDSLCWPTGRPPGRRLPVHKSELQAMKAEWGRGLITTRRAKARRPQVHDGPGGRPVGRHKLSRRLSRRPVAF